MERWYKIVRIFLDLLLQLLERDVLDLDLLASPLLIVLEDLVEGLRRRHVSNWKVEERKKILTFLSPSMRKALFLSSEGGN